MPDGGQDMSLLPSESTQGPESTDSALSKSSDAAEISPLPHKATIHNLGVRENGTYYLWRRDGKAYERRFEGLQLLVLDLVGKRSTPQKILAETGQLDVSPEIITKTIHILCDLGILTIESIGEHDEGRSWFR
jgi:hypothetical protein